MKRRRSTMKLTNRSVLYRVMYHSDDMVTCVASFSMRCMKQHVSPLNLQISVVGICTFSDLVDSGESVISGCAHADFMLVLLAKFLYASAKCEASG